MSSPTSPPKSLLALLLLTAVLSGCPGPVPEPDGGAGGSGAGGSGGGAVGGGNGGGGGGGAQVDGGIDAGVDAGVDAGPSCRVVRFTGLESLTAGYTAPATGGQAILDARFSRPASSGSVGRLDFLDFQYLFDPPSVVPVSLVLDAGLSWFTCSACVLYSEDCIPSGAGCGRDYLARRGTFSLSAADPDAGRYAGAVSDLVLVPWDTDLDLPRDGGCVSIASAAWDAGF